MLSWGSCLGSEQGPPLSGTLLKALAWGPASLAPPAAPLMTLPTHTGLPRVSRGCARVRAADGETESPPTDLTKGGGSVVVTSWARARVLSSGSSSDMCGMFTSGQGLQAFCASVSL